MRLSRVACRLFVLSVLATCTTTSPLFAQQLRIETSVFVEDQDEPVSEAVTLFEADMVYHYVAKPSQVTIYRSPTSSRPGQFIILDQQSEKRTDISTDRIAGLMEKLNKWAAEQEDLMLKFSAQPVFEETYEEESGLLSLENPAWTYTVATVPAEEEQALKRYREFTDWYSKLNVLLHNTPPPGARLALNKALAKHEVVPVEIRREVESEDSDLRATHLFTWRLSRDDRQRIEDTRGQLTSFEKVDNADFIALWKDDTVVRGQSK